MSTVTIDNLRIDTNRDGMDIDCCKDVHISNCTVNSPWDDAICLKSSYTLGRPVATENVTITGCTVSGCYRLGTVLSGEFERFVGAPFEGENPAFWGRIKLGTESNGGFKRVTIANCVFDGCHGLAIESVDGGICEDIVITNIAMRDLVSGPLFVILGDRLRGPAGSTVGAVRRVLVSNVVASNCNADFPTVITGVRASDGATHRVTDIKISNFYVQQQGGRTQAQADLVPAEFNTGRRRLSGSDHVWAAAGAGLFLRHVDGLQMSQIEIASVAADERAPFVAQDVNDASWTAITAPAGNVPGAFALWPAASPEVNDWHIRASQANGYIDVDQA